jgi:hypothetical protein
MKHVPDAHGNCSRWCDHINAVPGKPWAMTEEVSK